MGDEREFSAVDVSKSIEKTSKPGPDPRFGMNLGDIRFTAQVVSGIQAA